MRSAAVSSAAAARGLLSRHRNLTRVTPAPEAILVSPKLKEFVEEHVLPGTDVQPSTFWSGLENIVRDMMPRNAELLQKRDHLQAKIDEWYKTDPQADDIERQRAFLREIGYLSPEGAGDGESAKIRTENVDREIASVAGPQLVCPVDNKRFVINAANARWGSLFDAFYGTNAVLDPPPKGKFDPQRGAAVFDAAHGVLDELFPLTGGSLWADVASVDVSPRGELTATTVPAGAKVGLAQPERLVGVGGDRDGGGRWSLLLKKNELHAELVFDASAARAMASAVVSSDGKASRAGLVDLRLESCVSTICDFEDSACTVDVDDKVGAYANWLGLMKRTITAELPGAADGAAGATRRLNPPRVWACPATGGEVTLPGQSLLLARNVGMHMETDMVVTSDAQPVPEHFVDALVTVACALHDVRAAGAAGAAGANSRAGSVYIVKPKMHGPEEVALACELFSRVEDVLGLPRHTVKMGVMDEERRTSSNLAACIDAASERLVFVNTGFLDRTADEIHTAMLAGPARPKAATKASVWYAAYEAGNVDTSLTRGLVGRAQIGKGMWAEPDDMRTMLATKGAQLDAGASCAWVPSPIAGTLHALHYLRTSVAETQARLGAAAAAASDDDALRRQADLLTPPVMSAAEAGALSAEEVQAELDNNAQGLLGYVVRWVGLGVGCSKVPDLSGKQLMEDRATLRISSQHIANWLHHGVVSEEQVVETLKRIAVVVDGQNAADPLYKPFAPSFDSPEWEASLELVFNGLNAPNGYTEPSLTKWRRERKAIDAEEARRAAQDKESERTRGLPGTGYMRGGSSMSGSP